MKYEEINLDKDIQRAIAEMGFTSPTAIQEKTIPLLLENSQDIIGLAQTGTGKTAAFGLPVLNNVEPHINVIQALVLCPTRELCIQITEEMNKFAKYTKGKGITAVYGGDPIGPQIKRVKYGTQIIVATPGRMLDLIKRRAVSLDQLKYAILDEADIMLNMGFKDELDQILEAAPEQRQSLLFSATMPREVARLAKGYMQDPIEITVGEKNAGTDTIDHRYYSVRASDKYETLKRIFDFYPGIYGIVFCKTKRSTQEVADKLIKDGYNAESLHGDLSQAQRAFVMGKFKSKTVRVLVATDIAARGLDVDDLSHVVHYNLPDENESYNHRSGRTGRAGKKGISIAIVNRREHGKLKQIERILNRKITEHKVPKGSDICEKQLVHLIDKMLAHQVNETEMKPYWDLITEKFKDTTPEDILLKFISVEFHRFIDYYADRRDITDSDERGGRDYDRGGRNDRGRGRYDRGGRDYDRGGRGRGGRDFDRSRNDRGGRDFDRSRNDRGGRDYDRGGRDFDRDRGGRDSVRGGSRSDKGLVTITMNVGRSEKVSPPEVIGIINDATGMRGINIGKIDIQQNQTTVMIDNAHVDNVLNCLEGSKYRSRTIQATRNKNTKGKHSK